ncbi:uncharacterized protein LOC132133362 [Carassius carassius]|uniref:uncharacterized protein LOC132133362 n=1 Tax=Carassius carassius TaxID=217509 RepID=UPI002868D0DC|nr:uncharacterized protein LOC132133362 [Carassius carassius]
MASKSPQEAPLPDRSPVYVGTPQGAGVFARSPPAEAVPAEPPKGATVTSRTTKTRKGRLAEHQSIRVSATQVLPMSSSVVPVHSGTLQGALVTKSSPQQGSNPRMTEQQRKKRREQWRQQQRQRRQQKASDNVEVCEPPPKKKLGVEIEKVQLKLKLGNHQAPKPRSQLTLMMVTSIPPPNTPTTPAHPSPLHSSVFVCCSNPGHVTSVPAQSRLLAIGRPL